MSVSPALAVCGKGGVGKTAISALLARALQELGARPLLLVDADPVGGLGPAVGLTPARTLADVRQDVLAAARDSTDADRQQLAQTMDYRVLEALSEHGDVALLSMGRSREPGCFCPVHTLLRHAIETLAGPYAAVLVDAEAGVEQIQREVTRRIHRILVVVDGSQRSLHTLDVIRDLAGGATVEAVLNRVPAGEAVTVPQGVRILGRIPEDPRLQAFDRAGRPLWELPADNPALAAAGDLARTLAVIP